MPDEFGFGRGFLLDKEKSKDGLPKPNERKPGQLSNIDRQLVGMGKNPGEYHQGQLDQSGSSNLEDSKESPRASESKILDGFKQIGGKAELSDAKSIWLGESHVDEKHYIENLRLVVSIAKSNRGKKDIIVLMEGRQTGEEIDKNEFLNSKTNALLKVFENPEEIVHTLVKESLPFTLLDNVRIFGCDNMELLTDAQNTSSNQEKIYREIRQHQEAGNWEKVSALDHQFELGVEKLRNFGAQRNITWLDTHSNKRAELPEAIIIGIGGIKHITEDPNFIGKVENLENGSYIALQPRHELPPEEEAKRSKKYYIE